MTLLQQRTNRLRDELHTEIACRQATKTSLQQEMAQTDEVRNRQISAMKETWKQMQNMLDNKLEFTLGQKMKVEIMSSDDEQSEVTKVMHLFM
eukprot:12431546-Karenia_brevis.AAC.2